MFNIHDKRQYECNYSKFSGFQIVFKLFLQSQVRKISHHVIKFYYCQNMYEYVYGFLIIIKKNSTLKSSCETLRILRNILQPIFRFNKPSNGLAQKFAKILLYHRKPIRDPLKTYQRPIRDLSETHWRPICLIGDPYA